MRASIHVAPWIPSAIGAVPGGPVPITRRNALLGLGGALVMPIAAADPLRPTPQETLGPYYPCACQPRMISISLASLTGPGERPARSSNSPVAYWESMEHRYRAQQLSFGKPIPRVAIATRSTRTPRHSIRTSSELRCSGRLRTVAITCERSSRDRIQIRRVEGERHTSTSTLPLVIIVSRRRCISRANH